MDIKTNDIYEEAIVNDNEVDTTYDVDMSDEAESISALPIVGAAGVCLAVAGAIAYGVSKLVKHLKAKRSTEDVIETTFSSDENLSQNCSNESKD